MININKIKWMAVFMMLAFMFSIASPVLAQTPPKVEPFDTKVWAADTCQEGTVFAKLSCKAAITLQNLKPLMFAIAGFGIIAFSFAAIFGKIQWKHLGSIIFGLFLVAMVGPFITYIVGDNVPEALKFGTYLPSPEDSNIDGSVALQKQKSMPGAAGLTEALGDTAAAGTTKATEALAAQKAALTGGLSGVMGDTTNDGSAALKAQKAAIAGGFVGAFGDTGGKVPPAVDMLRCRGGAILCGIIDWLGDVEKALSDWERILKGEKPINVDVVIKDGEIVVLPKVPVVPPLPKL